MEKNDGESGVNFKSMKGTVASGSGVAETSDAGNKSPIFSFSPVLKAGKFISKLSRDQSEENDEDFDPEFLLWNRDSLLQLQEQQRREQFLKGVQSANAIMLHACVSVQDNK
jgi:hypothetical protein